MARSSTNIIVLGQEMYAKQELDTSILMAVHSWKGAVSKARFVTLLMFLNTKSN
jgi:hypothetical protein